MPVLHIFLCTFLGPSHTLPEVSHAAQRMCATRLIALRILSAPPAPRARSKHHTSSVLPLALAPHVPGGRQQRNMGGPKISGEGFFFFQKLLLILLSSLSSSSSSLLSWLLWYGSRPLGVDTTLGSLFCVVLASCWPGWAQFCRCPGPGHSCSLDVAPLAWGVRDRTQQCPCGDGALHRHWASPYLVAEKPATAPCWQFVLASGITFTEKIEGKAIAKYIVPVTVTEMTLGLARLQSSCYGAPPVLQLMLLLL